MNKFNPINHLQPFKNITPRHTVILEPPTTTLATSSGTSIHLSSLVRFLDASVVEPMILLVDHAADECGASIKKHNIVPPMMPISQHVLN